MTTNEQLIRDFYDAFGQRDGAAMGEAYHDEATFADPVFPDLDADGVRAMWAMLTERGADLKVEMTHVDVGEKNGTASWEAWYTFSATGRKVHNAVNASFEFRDGKIYRHVDDFDFYRWTRQALGPMGVLLGWTPMIQNKIRNTASGQLEKYRAKKK